MFEAADIEMIYIEVNIKWSPSQIHFRNPLVIQLFLPSSNWK